MTNRERMIRYITDRNKTYNKAYLESINDESLQNLYEYFLEEEAKPKMTECK